MLMQDLVNSPDGLQTIQEVCGDILVKEFQLLNEDEGVVVLSTPTNGTWTVYFSPEDETEDFLNDLPAVFPKGGKKNLNGKSFRNDGDGFQRTPF